MSPDFNSLLLVIIALELGLLYVRIGQILPDSGKADQDSQPAVHVDRGCLAEIAAPPNFDNAYFSAFDLCVSSALTNSIYSPHGPSVVISSIAEQSYNKGRVSNGKPLLLSIFCANVRSSRVQIKGCYTVTHCSSGTYTNSYMKLPTCCIGSH